MVMHDLPEWQIRARRVGGIAYGMKSCKNSLVLKLGPKEIRLYEDSANQNEIYSSKMASNHVFGDGEKTKTVEDVRQAGKREGYLLSKLDRLLLKAGYIPNEIKFVRAA